MAQSRVETPWVGDYRDRAKAYDRARPFYPDALVDRLVSRVGVAKKDPVADVGSGTGHFTRALSARGFDVTGVEPDAAMRGQAPDLPGVAWREGRFEALGLADGSQRWIVAAQSFQRANPLLALPEIRRALVPGGHFSVVHYTHPQTTNEIAIETATLLRRHVPEYRNLDRGSRLRRSVSRCFSVLPGPAQRGVWHAAAAAGRPDLGGAGGALVSTGDFAHAVYDEIEQPLRFDRDGYLALWSSRARLATLGRERFEAFLEELERMLLESEAETIEVPCVYGAWTARARVGR